MRCLLSDLKRVALSALLLAMFTVAASAQFKASIQGTVADSTGAVVSGAKVTIVNKETARELTTTSNETGFYRVAGLPPGSYKVFAERDGFKRRELENVVIGAETAQGVDLILEAGQISETVTVTGESTPKLQTENANIDRGITTQEIRRLPQYGRDPYELLRLAPGIFGQGARSGSGGAVNLPNTTGPGGSNTSIFQVENVVPISANGQRVSANNFTIDGVSVNSLGWGGAAIVTPNQESVKEIRVTSTSYSAEDGRNSGAQIKVISMNGTNQYHGSALFKHNEPR
ncbi:MAG: carboxypeptidase regulatory-like domain-containing protein [Blastocatellia bacterium]